MRTIIDCFNREKVEETLLNQNKKKKKVIKKTFIVILGCLMSLLGYGAFYVYHMFTKPWWQFW